MQWWGAWVDTMFGFHLFSCQECNINGVMLIFRYEFVYLESELLRQLD